MAKKAVRAEYWWSSATYTGKVWAASAKENDSRPPGRWTKASGIGANASTSTGAGAGASAKATGAAAQKHNGPESICWIKTGTKREEKWADHAASKCALCFQKATRVHTIIGVAWIGVARGRCATTAAIVTSLVAVAAQSHTTEAIDGGV